MKIENIISLFIVLLSSSALTSQQHDAQWLFGYGSNLDPQSVNGGSLLDFRGDSLTIIEQSRVLNFDVTNTSMCDEDGNLLFYTNGISIANANHEVMQNGDGLNPGEFADDHAYYGYILDQGVLSIPIPESENEHFLFHMARQYPTIEHGAYCDKLYYSLVDMNGDGGLGTVREKNELLYEGKLTNGQLTSCRHANGRDWWILVRKYASNEYLQFIVTPSGVEKLGQTTIGIPTPDAIGQSLFTPDGEKFVHVNSRYTNEIHISVFDFDRCTGVLSNPEQKKLNVLTYSLGAAISPNSKFLYVSLFDEIYQFDLEVEDIFSSIDTVAVYDGFEYMVNEQISKPVYFKSMQLGPDGKIYISAPGGQKYLHRINYPNLEGLACDVAQHSIELPKLNAFSIPNFPNYQLGSTEEPCEPSFVVEIKDKDAIQLGPNPVLDMLSINSDSAIQNIEIFDTNGKSVPNYTKSIYKYHAYADLQFLIQGMYIIKIYSERGKCETRWIVKI